MDIRNKYNDKIIKKEYKYVNPVRGVSLINDQNSRTPIDFICEESCGFACKGWKLYVDVEIKSTLNDKTINETEAIFKNNFLASMFEHIYLKINGEVVSSVYIPRITCLIKKYLFCSGDDISLLKIADEESKSKRVRAVFDLEFLIPFLQLNNLLPLHNILLSFTRSENVYNSIGPGLEPKTTLPTKKPIIYFHDFLVKIPIIHYDPTVRNEITSLLTKSPLMYPYVSMKTIEARVPLGSNWFYELTNLYSGATEQPKYVIVVFQKESVSNKLEEHQHLFAKPPVRAIRIEISSNTYPEKQPVPVILNSDKEVVAYEMYLDYRNFEHHDRNCIISIDDFSKSPFFVINTSLYERTSNPLKRTININVEFSETLTENYIAYITFVNNELMSYDFVSKQIKHHVR